jgi:hypothetical protein
LPLVCLYEMCIWLAYFHERAEKKREAAEEAERRARRERANLAAAYTPADQPEELAESSMDSDSHPSGGSDWHADVPADADRDLIASPDPITTGPGIDDLAQRADVTAPDALPAEAPGPDTAPETAASTAAMPYEELAPARAEPPGSADARTEPVADPDASPPPPDDSDGASAQRRPTDPTGSPD